MLGFGPLGSFPLGAVPDLAGQLAKSTSKVALTITTLIVPDNSLVVADRKVAEGRLVSSTSVLWAEVATQLAADWTLARQLTSE